jgi:5'-deoxynucleotidase YfbR-like HD superfamily hydrolase
MTTIVSTGFSIPTATGRRFDVLQPCARNIEIVDVAVGLAQHPRWSGQLTSFYSVAQHSVEVSRRCAPTDALEGLLHDASEAYLGDLASPLKHSPFLAGFREVEASVERAIAERFGTRVGKPASVAR